MRVFRTKKQVLLQQWWMIWEAERNVWPKRMCTNVSSIIRLFIDCPISLLDNYYFGSVSCQVSFRFEGLAVLVLLMMWSEKPPSASSVEICLFLGTGWVFSSLGLGKVWLACGAPCFLLFLSNHSFVAPLENNGCTIWCGFGSSPMPPCFAHWRGLRRTR